MENSSLQSNSIEEEHFAHSKERQLDRSLNNGQRSDHSQSSFKDIISIVLSPNVQDENYAELSQYFVSNNLADYPQYLEVINYLLGLLDPSQPDVMHLHSLKCIYACMCKNFTNFTGEILESLLTSLQSSYISSPIEVYYSIMITQYILSLKNLPVSQNDIFVLITSALPVEHLMSIVQQDYSKELLIESMALLMEYIKRMDINSEFADKICIIIIHYISAYNNCTELVIIALKLCLTYMKECSAWNIKFEKFQLVGEINMLLAKKSTRIRSLVLNIFTLMFKGNYRFNQYEMAPIENIIVLMNHKIDSLSSLAIDSISQCLQNNPYSLPRIINEYGLIAQIKVILTSGHYNSILRCIPLITLIVDLLGAKELLPIIDIEIIAPIFELIENSPNTLSDNYKYRSADLIKKLINKFDEIGCGLQFIEMINECNGLSIVEEVAFSVDELNIQESAQELISYINRIIQSNTLI